MNMKRSVLVLALAVGCGDSGGGGPKVTNKPYPSCPDCMHAQYVIGPNGTTKGIVVPQSNSMASNLGCDIDGDGQIDNSLGKVFAALKQASPNTDVQASVDQAFTNGTVVVLFDMEYKPSVTDTTTAGLKGYIGAHDPTDPITMAPNYYNGGKFTVSMAVGDGFGGSVKGGLADFGPGNLTVQFPLVMDSAPLNANLEAASLTGMVSMTQISSGILCGAIPADQLKTEILPQVADLLSAQVKKGGSTADTLKSLFDTDMSCNTDPACMSGATGTCHCITEPEVENNSIIKSLLSPDLDLDPAKNNPFVTDTSDPTYKNDALSLGLGFNANHATFPAP